MKLLWGFLNYFVFLYPLYMSFVWTTGALIFYFRKERKNAEVPKIDNPPFFSIVVPAHNEENGIKDTVMHLENLKYPAYEVIVVNDGSSDKTAHILNGLTEKNSRWLKVIHLEPNSGKAKALNVGILFSKGELILAIDADCFLDENALNFLTWHFINFPRVGAVTGNPRIINRTTLLGKIQIGEYSSIIGLIKRSQRILGKLLTVSGVIAAFRRSALCDCGLFDSDTVTEDIDMTWKLQKKFWDVRYEPRALCWILTPETLNGLWCQRVRWAQGGIEVIKKHYDIWFDYKQRRFWPVYVEYVTTIFWSFSLGLMIFIWIISYLLYLFGIMAFKPAQPFIPPAWAGSILALMCLCQSLASLYIDSHYEKKSLLRYYFWVIWYPFLYWFISGAAVFAGFINVFIRKRGVSVKWVSPDRGIHTLLSSRGQN